MARKLKCKKKDYDVGLGTKKFHVFVKGRKSAIASKSTSSLESDRAVQSWAKKECEKYKNKKRK